MSPEAKEVIDYLKENLKISVSTENGDSNFSIVVNVEISLDDQLISESRDHFYIGDPNAY